MLTAAYEQPTPHRISVLDYYRMAETGILPLGARTELLDGEIIDMAPIGSRHAGTVAWLTRALGKITGEQAIVMVQSPLRLGDFAEPQPDLMLLRPRDDFYRAFHPGPQDVLLVIEVADSTLQYDTEVKRPLYARFGIPAYWIVDLEHRGLLVCTDPDAGDYRSQGRLSELSQVPIGTLPGPPLELSHLF
ncbi:MAG: Uma2 family endonuclease [Gammaproteobacteria bacterium]|nr:Uma2 family endonuclease [Gammaproteobacteria bacterium]MBU1654658.1 Uma2 family endonuclease [Gammaproteobacteria bacterium]MBU1962454.1 Uma2 family endonuclease [Gammaproteobacteria bacterium]